jgi:hypothetical protein
MRGEWTYEIRAILLEFGLNFVEFGDGRSCRKKEILVFRVP